MAEGFTRERVSARKAMTKYLSLRRSARPGAAAALLMSHDFAQCKHCRLIQASTSRDCSL
ncbi:msl2540 [Mesorhizobium japonicum MAFF 303099]|uniref:Msl2540 protein n=1 Tax=Mesorhizobium japonicum (strain LMG 29417 / CECT 9101 / MAFF 303099) TaxID=266835 RepID=Q98I68_RHILO|nr:msl2540 [Mesorhizobium japonicum MAFF 303099]